MNKKIAQNKLNNSKTKTSWSCQKVYGIYQGSGSYLKSKNKKIKSTPIWLITFADLMALLLCFFILLFSYSNIDLNKYKQVVHSMQSAFKINKNKPNLIYENFPISLSNDAEKKLNITETNIHVSNDLVKRNAKRIAEHVIEEIKIGNLELEVKDNQILIRIIEKGSFASGESTLKQTFLGSLDKISDILTKVPGKITIEGHTDNEPINNEFFHSNWELSAMRAASVLQHLLKNENLDPKRFSLSGNADNKPLVPNDSEKNKAINRRVELIILEDKEHELSSINDIHDETFIEIDTQNVVPFVAPVDNFSNSNNSESKESIKHTFPPLHNDEFDNKKDKDLGIYKEESFYNY